MLTNPYYNESPFRMQQNRHIWKNFHLHDFIMSSGKMMEKSVWRTSGHGSSTSWEMRARNGDRVSFPRWGKRNVISNHFAELILQIMEMEMRLLYSCFFGHFTLSCVFKNEYKSYCLSYFGMVYSRPGTCRLEEVQKSSLLLCGHFIHVRIRPIYGRSSLFLPDRKSSDNPGLFLGYWDRNPFSFDENFFFWTRQFEKHLI